MHTPDKIRNIAIIAHIDHGKTTLVDGLLSQAQVFHENQEVPVRAMDSFDQEKERGITIFSKPTSITYGEYKINIIDTPGHADFSCEVERVLGMVDSVLLVVDAKEGPMPQTRFVLSKALHLGLSPMVVLNKIDRPNADPDRVLDQVFDLFVELGAHDEQLDFRYCYASALKGYATADVDDEPKDFTPLFDMVIEHTPAAKGDTEAPFLLQVTSIGFDDFLGRQVGGRVLQGTVAKGDRLTRLTTDGSSSHAITALEGYRGLECVPLEGASVGDIIRLSGITEAAIGDTICGSGIEEPLPPIAMEAPTVSVDISASNSPFVGKSGKHVTLTKIRESLQRRLRSDASYTLKEKDEQTLILAGRGELHLAILFESMRRDNFEFCVGKPQVITEMIEETLHEPIAKVHIEVPEEFSGTVIEQLSLRKGEMLHLATDEQGITKIEFHVPVRGLVGYRNTFLTATRGLGILTSRFDQYSPWKGDIIRRTRGVLISMCSGKANSYACFNLESRGELFTKPGDDIYEGMIVGEHSRDNDLVVNMTKAKQLTNVRASGTDEKLLLQPPREFNLESAIGYINDDELVEVTPDEIRLRKKLLKEVDRNRAKTKKS